MERRDNEDIEVIGGVSKRVLKQIKNETKKTEKAKHLHTPAIVNRRTENQHTCMEGKKYILLVV